MCWRYSFRFCGHIAQIQLCFLQSHIHILNYSVCVWLQYVTVSQTYTRCWSTSFHTCSLVDDFAPDQGKNYTWLIFSSGVVCVHTDWQTGKVNMKSDGLWVSDWTAVVTVILYHRCYIDLHEEIRFWCLTASHVFIYILFGVHTEITKKQLMSKIILELKLHCMLWIVILQW